MLRFIIFLALLSAAMCENKYSEAANKAASLRDLEKPFRMAKLNLLWKKALLRVTETKLMSLFGELKIHDKEEITYKRFKSEMGDSEGLKEAELRKKLIGIMSTYGLLEHFEPIEGAYKPGQVEPSDAFINKSLFKDKKLNKLWSKAETAGFTAEELRALKEEFSHHQDKVDQYLALMENLDAPDQTAHENSIDEKLRQFNEIDTGEESRKPASPADELRKRHLELRDGYDRLHQLAVKGPQSKEFVEPKVEGLWRIALDSHWSPGELESLRLELKHYEGRLLKLRHLQAEAALAQHKSGLPPGVKSDPLMEETIKKQSRKIDALHEHLETRIMQKHIEL